MQKPESRPIERELRKLTNWDLELASEMRHLLPRVKKRSGDRVDIRRVLELLLSGREEKA